jgi:predicted Rossmann-fold nucleotide-binding protein
MNTGTHNVTVMPEGSLELLSQQEVDRLKETAAGGVHELLRRCALAVLNAGSETDSAKEVFDQFKDFDVQVLQRDHGVKLALNNAPEAAFVEGTMIRGIREMLFAVLRDIVFINNEMIAHGSATAGPDITNRVFNILRNANALKAEDEPSLVVCWGGHSIGREEYEYCKDVGYELGLRLLDICTGCGPGSMKAPMKGATIGHAKQRKAHGRYLGITEPGIIAAEPPNPIVNELVIMPDMEKRLEAFVRTAHAIIIFPGGAGTLEELLFLLGILLHPDNEDLPLPVILAGPETSRTYVEEVDAFIGSTLGAKAQSRYEVILGDPARLASIVKAGVDRVTAYRRENRDAFFYNWGLTIDPEFQRPFIATHEAMATLEIRRDMETHLLAANLRRAYSGVVAGNIRDEGIRAVEKHGPFEISGDSSIMASMDTMLAGFVRDHRMRLPGKPYDPCYRVCR